MTKDDPLYEIIMQGNYTLIIIMATLLIIMLISSKFV